MYSSKHFQQGDIKGKKQILLFCLTAAGGGFAQGRSLTEAVVSS